MYLADTSIWIDLLNNRADQNTKKSFEQGQLGLTNMVYFEVLQGCRSHTFNRIKTILTAQKFYYLKDQKSYEQAALIYAKCRQNGITIRSTIDCLIAQCAIEHNLTLLHNDKDYPKIATITPTLNHQSP